MDNTKKEASGKEYIICNVVLLSLIIGVIFKGFSSIALFVLIPACIAYIFVRFGLKHTFLPIVFTLAVPSFVSKEINFLVLLMTLPMALMLGFAIKNKYGLLKTVSFGCAGELLSYVFAYFMLYEESGTYTSMAQLVQIIDDAIAMAAELYALPQDYAAMLSQMFVSVLPAILICSVVVVVYLAHYVCLAVLKRRDSSYVGAYRTFCMLKAEKSCVLAIATFFVISMFTDGIIATTIINIIIILIFFTFACGTSLAVFFIKKIRNRLGRFILYIALIIFTLTMPSILIFGGMIDAFANIRGLCRQV